MISDSEIEDFDAAIAKAGFDPNDFTLTPLEDAQATPEVEAVTGTVTVLRESNTTAVTYTAGYGSTWVAEFERDLLVGKFGYPLPAGP